MNDGLEQRKLTKQYFTFVYTTITLISTIWLIGTVNVQALQIVYPLTCAIVLAFRIEEFYRKKYMLFFIELCYFLLVWSAVMVACRFDVKYIYPFLHGPLLWFSFTNAEAYVPHNLNKVTSYIIHNFGAFVTCCLYLNGKSGEIYTLENLSDNFEHYFSICSIIFFSWYFFFSIFLFAYNGTGLTLLRHKFKIAKDLPTPFDLKVKYFIGYPILMLLGLCFGIVSMHCRQLNITMIFLTIFCGILQAGWYYFVKPSDNPSWVKSDSKNKLTILKLYEMLRDFIQNKKSLQELNNIGVV